MHEVFCDTSYWRALIDHEDPYRSAAVEAKMQLKRDTVLVTTEPVMNEFLNAVSSHGPHIRSLALTLVDRLRASHVDGVLVHIDHTWFDDALTLWRKRMDKGWSLTDCHSMLVMKARNISLVLTTDHHFQQGGFNVLMPVV